MPTTLQPESGSHRARRIAVGLPGGQRVAGISLRRTENRAPLRRSGSGESFMVEQYALCATGGEIRERFCSSAGCYRARQLGEIGGRWRIEALQPVLVITQREDGSRELRPMQWGLAPSWEPNLRRAADRTCAPALGAPTNQVWRNAFRQRRCLVPATAFYAGREAATEIPQASIYRQDKQMFAFAGIWEEWHDPFGASLYSCAILTTTANPLVAPFSSRMPVILSREGEAAWLDTTQKVSALSDLLCPYPAEELTVGPVLPAFNQHAATPPLPKLLTRIEPYR